MRQRLDAEVPSQEELLLKKPRLVLSDSPASGKGQLMALEC